MKAAKIASVRFLPREDERRAPPPSATAPRRKEARARGPSAWSQALLGLVLLSMLMSMFV